MNTYTAIIKHEADWWYGWVEEVPGVNAQETSREELILALKECLSEALQLNREDALAAAETDYVEEEIAL
jgi:predicted RNase H-like HicB family nuclease